MVELAGRSIFACTGLHIVWTRKRTLKTLIILAKKHRPKLRKVQRIVSGKGMAAGTTEIYIAITITARIVEQMCTSLLG